MGDYAVVVYGDQIYPAIVGDVGPNDKVGEASLRIAKQINALATPNNRPVSDLEGDLSDLSRHGRTPFGPPDLEKMRARCETLVQELGGATVPLYHWPELIPTPTPVSTPDVTPSPNESPTASPSPTFAFPTPVESPSATGSSSPMPSLDPNEFPTRQSNAKLLGDAMSLRWLEVSRRAGRSAAREFPCFSICPGPHWRDLPSLKRRLPSVGPHCEPSGQPPRY